MISVLVVYPLLRLTAVCVLAASLHGGGIGADDVRPPSPELPAAETAEKPRVIVLEPSDDPNPPPVVIGTPRPDGTGRIAGKMVDFTLTDQLGRTVTRETLLGHPWAANFIFAGCPSHCPATLAELYQLQRRLRDTDVKLVTITVDPETDDVAKMAELSRAFGADPERWLFLTGDVSEVRKLIVDGFQQPMVANAMQLAHSLNLMHVDAEGNVVGKYRFHYQEPEGPDQLNRLRQVLLGEIETPEENRFVPIEMQQAIIAAQQGTATTDPRAGSDLPPERDLQGPRGEAPDWVHRLRTTNALLNAVATLLLLVGFAAIQAGRVAFHKRMMLMAFGVSVAFLACYLTYHGALKHFTGIGHKPYTGSESLQTTYRVLLGSHVILAAVVPVLAIITIRRGLKEQWDAHRRIAKVTFPIWLYVSVTGVVIYFMNA